MPGSNIRGVMNGDGDNESDVLDKFTYLLKAAIVIILTEKTSQRN